MKAMSKKQYNDYVATLAEPSPLVKNMAWAFCVGGGICAGGEWLRAFFMGQGLEETMAGCAVSVCLVGLAALLTGLGWYNKLAKRAGAGTLVPITGFANAMVAPGIEFRSEGLVYGVAGKMFAVAGPVLVYGVAASTVYGILYWVTKAI